MNAVLLLQLALIILISLGLQRLSLSIGAPSLLALLALPPGNSGNPGLTSSADAVKSAQMGSVVYASCSPTVRAVPLLDAGFAALPAGLVSGTAAAGAVDGSGSRAAFALNGAFAVAIAAVFIAPVAMCASV